MSPSAMAPEVTFTVTPMNKSPKEKHNFGAIVTDLDLNDISGECTSIFRWFSNYCINTSLDADVQHLSDAIWTHKVIVVKGQKDLAPIKQWELVTRFDPNSPQVHSHGDLKTFNAKGGLLSVSKKKTIF